MKINILTPHLKISGGVMILVAYAHHLACLGHEVDLIVENPIGWRRFLANLTKQKPKWMKGKKFALKRILRIDERCLPRADILMVSTYKQANAIKNFKDSFGKKVYLVQHDERLYHGKPDEVERAYRLPYKFIAVSTWIKERLDTFSDQKAELLLNTIDRNIFHPYEAARSDENIRILILHHTYEWKGAAEGARMVEDLKKKYDNIKLVMYGARQKNISCDEFHFKPFGRETARLFSGCDIFLCPSWDEGFGLPSLEAMSCGCSLATYDNGGSRDFAFDGLTALVAKSRNPDDLKRKLEILVRDQGLRKRISEQGLEFVKKMPTWEDQAKKLEKILLAY